MTMWSWMYFSIYAYTDINICIYVYVYVDIHIYICRYVCMYVCMYSYLEPGRIAPVSQKLRPTHQGLRLTLEIRVQDAPERFQDPN